MHIAGNLVFFRAFAPEIEDAILAPWWSDAESQFTRGRVPRVGYHPTP